MALPEPAGRDNIAPAPERNQSILVDLEQQTVYSAEQALLDSHLEPAGRTFLERKAVVGKPSSLLCT